MVRFEEGPHLYYDGGELIPSVTYILQCTGVATPLNAYMRKALARGRAVHKAIQLFDEGKLDFTTVDSRIEGWLQAFVTWQGREGERFKRARNEVVMHARSHGYVGKADKVVDEPDAHRIAVVEFKSGEREDWHALQVNAYQLAAIPAKYRKGLDRSPGGWLVYLHKNGTYDQEEVTFRVEPWMTVMETFGFARERHMAELKRRAREEALDD